MTVPSFFSRRCPIIVQTLGPNASSQPFTSVFLTEDYTKRPAITSGVKSIDRVTWSDRVYQMRNDAGTFTYLLEQAQSTAGFLTVHVSKDELVVAEVVIGADFQGNGFCGVLMRFAESLARQADCRTLRLNAIKDKIDMYAGFGYAKSPGRPPFTPDDEEYYPMERLVLYHQSRSHVDGSSISIPSDEPRVSIIQEKAG